MPKKNNQQNKPNGFILYSDEIKNQLLREGHIIRNKPDLIAAAAPKWQQLPEEEKEYYKDLAKWEWDNRHVTGQWSKPRPRERRDCTGALMVDRVDLVKVNEDKRKREREEVFMSWKASDIAKVKEMKFYLVSFVCLLEEPDYQPVELGAVEFSLQNGIERSFHKFINPGPIPAGYRFKAQQTSEMTHKIPIEGLAKQVDTYTRIYDEFFNFLSRGSQHIPPIYAKISECERTEGCIKWLARNAGRSNNLKRIYELEGVILDLNTYLSEQPQNFMQSKQCGTDLISSTIFDWDTRCEWHEENESKDCALGTVNRYSYCIANYFCEHHRIPITGHHLPVKRQDICYTLIPSSSVPSRNNSKVGSRAEPASRTSCRSEDIADRVAKKLLVEERNQRMEEDEELQRQQRELEQKKRWLSLRGGNQESVATHQNSNYESTANNTQFPQKEDYPASKPVFLGRGRGRGAMAHVNLRRPGEPPKSNVATAPATVSTHNVARTEVAPPPGFRGFSDNVAPPPGFGRGTQMYAASSVDSKLWAGLTPAPHASEAPIPPHTWVNQ